MFEDIEKATRMLVSETIGDVEPENVEAVIRSIQQDMIMGSRVALVRIQNLITEGKSVAEIDKACAQTILQIDAHLTDEDW